MAKKIETSESKWTNLCSCSKENSIAKFKFGKENMEKERNNLKELLVQLKTLMECKSEAFEKQYREDLKLNELDAQISEIENLIKPKIFGEQFNFENYDEVLSSWDDKMKGCLTRIDDMRKSYFKKIFEENFYLKQKLMWKLFEQSEDRILNLMESKQKAICYIKLVSSLIKTNERINSLLEKDIFIKRNINIDDQIKINIDEIEKFKTFLKTHLAMTNDKDFENKMKSSFESIKQKILNLSELIEKNSKKFVNVSKMQENKKSLGTDMDNINNQIKEYCQFLNDTEYSRKFLKKYKKYNTRSFQLLGSISIINDGMLKIEEQNSIIEILKFDIKSFDVNYEKMKFMNSKMAESKNYMSNEIQSIMDSINSFMEFIDTYVKNIETNIINYNQYIEFKYKIEHFIELMEMCQTEFPLVIKNVALKEDDYQNIIMFDQIVKTYNESIAILDKVGTRIFQLPESKLYNIETLKKQYNQACDYEIKVQKLIGVSRDNSLTKIDLSNILKQIGIIEDWLTNEEVKLNEYNIQDMINKDLLSAAQNIIFVLQLSLTKICSNLRNLKNYIDENFTEDFHPIERKNILDKFNAVVKHYNSLFNVLKTKNKIILGGVTTLDTEGKLTTLINNHNDILNICENILKLYSHSTNSNVKLKMEHIEEAYKAFKDETDKIESEIESLTRENPLYEKLKSKVNELKNKNETFNKQLDKIKILIEDIKFSEDIDTDIAEINFNCTIMENIYQEKYLVQNDIQALAINNFMENMEKCMKKNYNKQELFKKSIEDPKYKDKPYLLNTQVAIKNIQDKFSNNQIIAAGKKTIIQEMIKASNWFEEGRILLEYWSRCMKEFKVPIDRSKLYDSFIYEECKQISKYFSTKFSELLKPERLPRLPDKDIIDSNILIGKIKEDIQLPNGVIFEAKKGDYIVIFKKLQNEFMIVENGRNRAVIKSKNVEILDKNILETNLKKIWKFPLQEIRNNHVSELKSSLIQSQEMFNQAEKTLLTYEEFKSEHKKLENISTEFEFMVDQIDYLLQNYENLSFVIIQQENSKLKTEFDEKSKELDELMKGKSSKDNGSNETWHNLRVSVSNKMSDLDMKLLSFNPCFTSREAQYPKVLELRKKLCLSYLLEKDVITDCETFKTLAAIQIELKELEALKQQILSFFNRDFKYISNCHIKDLDEIMNLIDKNAKILQKIEKYKFNKDLLSEIKLKYNKYASWSEYADVIIKSISLESEFDKIEINRSEMNALLSAHDTMSKDIQSLIEKLDKSVFETSNANDVEAYLTKIKLIINNNNKQYEELNTKIDYLYYINMFNREISYFEKNIKLCEKKMSENDAKIKKGKLAKKFHSYIIEIFDNIVQKIETFSYSIIKIASNPAELLQIQEELTKCKNRLNNITINKTISVQNVKNLNINSKIKNILSFYLNTPSYNYNTWKYVKDLHVKNLESYNALKKEIPEQEWIQFLDKTKHIVKLESKIKEFGSYFTDTQSIYDANTNCLAIYSKIIYNENILINITNDLMIFPNSYKNYIWYKNLLTEINSIETDIENLKTRFSDFKECELQKELKNHLFLMDDKISIIKQLYEKTEKLYEADEKIEELENSIKNAIEFPKLWYGVLGEILVYLPNRVWDITKTFNENEITRCSNLYTALNEKEKKLNAIFVELYTIEDYFQKFQSHRYLTAYAENFENYKKMLLERKNSFNICFNICEFIEKSYYYLNEISKLQSKFIKLNQAKKIKKEDYIAIKNESEIFITKINELIIRGKNFQSQLKYLNIFKTILHRLTASKKTLENDLELFLDLNESYSKNKLQTELFNTSMKSLSKLEMEYEEEVLKVDNIDASMKKSFEIKLQEIMSDQINPFMDIKFESNSSNKKIEELHENQKQMIKKKLNELRTTMGFETTSDKVLIERLKNLSHIEGSVVESVWNKSRNIYDTLLFLIEENMNISNKEKMETNIIHVGKEIESLQKQSNFEKKRNTINEKSLKKIENLNFYIEKMNDSKEKIESKVNEYKEIIESEKNLTISLDEFEKRLESLIQLSYSGAIELNVDSTNLFKEKDDEISSLTRAIDLEIERSLNIKRKYLSSTFSDKKTIYTIIENYFSSCTILYLRLCQITFCLGFTNSNPNFKEQSSSLDKTYNELKFILKSKFTMNDVEMFLNNSQSEKMSLIKQDMVGTFSARNNFISYYYLFFLFFNNEMEKVPTKTVFLEKLNSATAQEEKVEQNKNNILKFATKENIKYFQNLFEKVNGRYEFLNVCDEQFY